MKLDELERFVSSVIMQRGETYRKNGHITDLEEVDDGRYHAEVEGSELYEVKVNIGPSGDVLFSDCDCPFAADALCKHQAAVLLEIRALRSRPKPKGKPKLAEQLEALSKDQLVKLVLELAHEIKGVKPRLDAHLMLLSDALDMETIVKIIRAPIKQYSDRDGLVPYRYVLNAIKGAEQVLKMAEEVLQREGALQAVRISLCALREMAELIQSSEDTEGYIFGTIDECLGVIEQAVESVVSRSSGDRGTIFAEMLEEIQHDGLDEEWQLSLLRSAAPLVEDKEQKREWHTYVRKLEAETARGNSSSYYAKEIAELKNLLPDDE